MYAAAIRLELRIREAHSLKEKRRILKSVIADLRRTFEVSVAEVDYQDLWQRTAIGVALVAPQPGHLDRVIHSLERRLEARTDIEVLGTAVDHLEIAG